MTPRETMIEAMAVGLAEARLGKGAWAKMPEAERNLWLGDVEFGVIPALNATLPALGLAVVPVEATPHEFDALWNAAVMSEPSIVSRLSAHDLRILMRTMRTAMLAATPNPLAGKK